MKQSQHCTLAGVHGRKAPLLTRGGMHGKGASTQPGSYTWHYSYHRPHDGVSRGQRHHWITTKRMEPRKVTVSRQAAQCLPTGRLQPRQRRAERATHPKLGSPKYMRAPSEADVGQHQQCADEAQSNWIQIAVMLSALAFRRDCSRRARRTNTSAGLLSSCAAW